MTDEELRATVEATYQHVQRTVLATALEAGVSQPAQRLIERTVAHLLAELHTDAASLHTIGREARWLMTADPARPPR